MRRALLVLVPLVLGACDSTYHTRKHFVVGPDSVQLPDTIAAQDSLTAKFFGEIGNSDCFQLSSIESAKPEPTQVIFQVIGVYESTGTCNPMEVELDGAEKTVRGPFANPLKVLVARPGQEPLEYDVEVVN